MLEMRHLKHLKKPGCDDCCCRPSASDVRAVLAKSSLRSIFISSKPQPRRQLNPPSLCGSGGISERECLSKPNRISQIRVNWDMNRGTAASGIWRSNQV